ncbi:terpenoid synthase [Penicillium verhagenii]|uniref:terpenoid synthase n=1 Tax=Penicillium verhagenii TaxID=1562060 RepID=UPI0025458716|nr:terpenoid synthase [Penicillium verhagenii]KAJ5935473.1 terpenoid synthase [Penicillium verhagenii]
MIDNARPNGSVIDTPVSKDEYTQLVERFLQGASFQIFPAKDTTALEEYLFNQMLGGEIDAKKASKLSKQGASIAHQFYPLQSSSPELHRLTGLYGAYFVALDDICAAEADMRGFRRSFIRNLPQAKLFEGCANMLRELDDHYLEFCSDKAITGLISHMSSAVLESETEGKFSQLRLSPGFPQYFRYLTGNAEAFVWLMVPRDVCPGYGETFKLFIQAVPELIDFTNKVNDILSFYKESIVSSESDGYVYHRAEVNQVTPLQCLNEMVDEVHDNIDRIEAMVVGDADLFEVAKAYIRGYIGYHIIEPRYKIGELGVPCLK